MCHTSIAARASAISRPRWGALYATVLPQVAALGVVEALHSPAALRVALRCALALGLFATMAVWQRANRLAFDLQNWCDCAGQRMTIRVIESQRLAPPAQPLEPDFIAPALAEEDYELVGR
jgi:hypothetical protein